MTSRLVSIHSWCVTGTPIQKTLQGCGISFLISLFCEMRSSQWVYD